MPLRDMTTSCPVAHLLLLLFRLHLSSSEAAPIGVASFFLIDLFYCIIVVFYIIISTFCATLCLFGSFAHPFLIIFIIIGAILLCHAKALAE